jgi:protein tyrosine/serine phosphatase
MTSRQQLKRWSVGLALFLITSGLIHYFFLSNFRGITHQTGFRSGQISPFMIHHVLTRLKIKTIINLRGQNKHDLWYQQELLYSQANHINHIDLRLSSTKLPEPKQLIQLVETLRSSTQPILIHCQSGADRTGFAAAILEILQGSSLREAKRQFSWRYYGFRSPRIGHLSFDKYEHWLSAHHLDHSREHFLAWVHANDRYVF